MAEFRTEHLPRALPVAQRVQYVLHAMCLQHSRCKCTRSAVIRKRMVSFNLANILYIFNDSVLELLHRVDMGNVAVVSKVNSAPIFRVKVCKFGEVTSIYRFLFRETPAGGTM
jgi:hypothetical protein